MFIINFLFYLPLWLTAIVLLLFFGGFALGGMWLTRKYLLPRWGIKYEDAGYGAPLVQSAMLLYSLVAALTVISVWQRYSEVSGIVSAEATSIASLWRDIGGYPQPLRDEARETLRGYTRQVIDEAWPQQAKGMVPSEGVVWMDKLQDQLFAFKPMDAGQQVIHAEALRAFNSLIQQRRQRVDSVQGGLPGVLWAVLIPGALVCLTLFFFFYVHNARLQAVLLLGVAGSMAMVLFVIIALDRPFAGETGISANSYRLIYEHHMQK